MSGFEMQGLRLNFIYCRTINRVCKFISHYRFIYISNPSAESSLIHSESVGFESMNPTQPYILLCVCYMLWLSGASRRCRNNSCWSQSCGNGFRTGFLIQRWMQFCFSYVLMICCVIYSVQQPLYRFLATNHFGEIVCMPGELVLHLYRQMSSHFPS